MRFSSTPMTVITLSGFIVIAENTYLVYYIGQPILESMRRPFQGLWEPPEHDL